MRAATSPATPAAPDSTWPAARPWPWGRWRTTAVPPRRMPCCRAASPWMWRATARTWPAIRLAATSADSRGRPMVTVTVSPGAMPVPTSGTATRSSPTASTAEPGCDAPRGARTGRQARPGSGRAGNDGSAVDEGAFDDVVAGLAGARGDAEAAPVQQPAGVRQHLRAAAEHQAVRGRIQGSDAHAPGELAGFDERGDAAHVAEGLARDRGEIDQLVAHQLAQVFVLEQAPLQPVAVGQVGDLAHAVHDDDLLEALVGLRFGHQAQE